MGQGLTIAVTGLKREARILAGPNVRAIASGGDGARLQAELEAACEAATGVISIGLGGALIEGLRPGDWVVASSIVSPGGDEEIETDQAWRERLLMFLPKAQMGAITASQAMVVDASGKTALRAATGAAAVDMESLLAARVAQAHGLPFAAARTISDGARRDLPMAAQAGMRSDGGMAVGAVLAALARRPQEFPALIRTAIEAETAFGSLLRGRKLLGGALMGPGPDLGELLLDVS